MNQIAQQLRMAAQTAPYRVEKERYLDAAQEIERLQQIIDGTWEDSQVSNVKVYEGEPWHADESDTCVRIFRGYLQIIKAPKQGTAYEEYWPDPHMLTWILKVLNEAESQTPATRNT